MRHRAFLLSPATIDRIFFRRLEWATLELLERFLLATTSEYTPRDQNMLAAQPMGEQAGSMRKRPGTEALFVCATFSGFDPTSLGAFPGSLRPSCAGTNFDAIEQNPTVRKGGPRAANLRTGRVSCHDILKVRCISLGQFPASGRACTTAAANLAAASSIARGRPSCTSRSSFHSPWTCSPRSRGSSFVPSRPVRDECCGLRRGTLLGVRGGGSFSTKMGYDKVWRPTRRAGRPSTSLFGRQFRA